MKSKKALAASTILGIIIVIVAFGAISYAGVRITGIIPQTFDKTSCQASVLTRAVIIENYAIGIKDLIIPDLKCETEKLCLTTKEECATGYKKLVTDEEGMKKAVVNATYDCWWMLGEGKRVFLRKPESVIKTQRECVICSKIKFSGVSENIDISSKMNDLIPGKGISYGMYTHFEGDTSLNPSQEYAVIFKQELELLEIAKSSIDLIPLTAQELQDLKCSNLEEI